MTVSRATVLQALLPGLEKMFGMTYAKEPRSLLREPGAIQTQLRDVPTETLRDLWLVKWGQRAVRAECVYDAYAAEDGIMDVMHELNNRRLVSRQTQNNIETLIQQHYYVLEKEAHADC